VPVYTIYMLLRRVAYRLARRRVALAAIVFVVLWLLSATLFYRAERGTGLSYWDSLYWALITMATVGYGDIVPTNGAARAVAAATAVFGIATYTLLISVLADYLLEATVRAAMGMGRLRGKRFIVIGEGPVCDEVVRELASNGLAEETGWVRETQPRGDPGVDYVVGELDESTLRRGGVGEAERVIICYDDDSKSLHAAALARRINPGAGVSALARDPLTIEILRGLGVDSVVPLALVGRILASSAFEPAVTLFLADATTARGNVDLVELEAPGETVAELERRTGYRAVAIVKPMGAVEPAAPERRLAPGEKLVALRRAPSSR